VPKVLKLVSFVALVAALLAPAAAAHAAPNAYVAYASGGQIQIGTVDLGAGAPSVVNIGSTGRTAGVSSITGVALSPSGALYGVDSGLDDLVTIDPSNGSITASVDLDIDVAGASITVTSDGVIWLVNGNSLRTVDPTTGATTQVTTLPAGMFGLASRCLDTQGTNEIWMVDSGDQQVYRYTIATKTATALPQTLGLPKVNGPALGFDADGTLWGLHVNIVKPVVITVDTTTGVATNVGNSGPWSAYGLAIVPTTCPQPPEPPQPPPDAGSGSSAATPVSTTPNFTG